MRDLAGDYKLCEIDIANRFLKERQIPEINSRVGSYSHIFMTRSVKKNKLRH